MHKRPSIAVLTFLIALVRSVADTVPYAQTPAAPQASLAKVKHELRSWSGARAREHAPGGLGDRGVGSPSPAPGEQRLRRHRALAR